MLFDAWLRQFNLWRLVTGDLSIARSTYLLSEHLLWLGILAGLYTAVLMLLNINRTRTTRVLNARLEPTCRLHANHGWFGRNRITSGLPTIRLVIDQFWGVVSAIAMFCRLKHLEV